MKKLIALMLAAIMVFGLAACSQAPAAAPAAAPAEAAPAEAAAEAPAEEPAEIDFPTRTIEFIVPFGAGGGTDVLYRLIQKYAEPIAGVSIVVNNIVGSGGLIGRQALADADPDGYTIGYNDHSNSNDNLLYDGVTLSGADYEPLIRIATDSLVILASNKSGITNMAELIEAAKAEGGINCATAGAWSAQDFLRLGLQDEFGITLNHLPFESGTAGVNAAAAGDTDIAFCFASEAIAQIDAGNVVPVAVTGTSRNAAVPDIPTIIESGFDYSYLQWRSMVLPAGTPNDVCEKLSDIFGQVYENPDFLAELSAAGFEAAYMPHSEFHDFYYQAQAEYQEIIAKVKAAG